MPLFKKTPPIGWARNPKGLSIVFNDAKDFHRARSAKGDEALQLALLRMRLLLEDGRANEEDPGGKEIANGLFLQSRYAVRLDNETRSLFGLPLPWSGGFQLEVRSLPQWPDFSASLNLIKDGRNIREWRLTGPILEVGREFFLPTPEQYAALEAIVDWSTITPSDRAEYQNLLLLSRLHSAKKDGCRINLDAFAQLRVQEAGEMEVEVVDAGHGELSLVPRFAGIGDEFTAAEIESRLHQLSGADVRAILRAQNRNASTIVLLDEVQTRRARALISNRKVPTSERAAFLRDPSGWLSARVLTDVDAEFSPRVIGVEVWRARYSGAATETGIDWFDKASEFSDRLAASFDSQCAASGSKEVSNQDRTTDRESGNVVPKIYDNDDEPAYGNEVHREVDAPDMEFNLVESEYLRMPLPHQREAVGWLLAHAERSSRCSGGAGTTKGGGFLLADDMGLGKSFSVLVFLAEWQARQRRLGREPKAVLIVAPVTLIENWRSEIAKSYTQVGRFFQRVTYAYPDGDLIRFRTDTGDVADPGDGDPQTRMKSWGLIFGTGGIESIDCPGTLVFTTYATLRNYRFSFAGCRWATAIFDEAQNLKNPNALQTVAAKALNAEFRVLLTGTPVENHLGDLWSLMDLAEPSFLSSFQRFRREYVAPILADRSKVIEVGRNLRNRVGTLMLRRLKDQELQGLPTKTTILHTSKAQHEFDERIVAVMRGRQKELYDSVLDSARSTRSESQSGDVTHHWLRALWNIREVVLHPSLANGGRIPIGTNRREAERILRESEKLAVVLRLLELIEAKREKVLIFATTIRLQEALSANLSRIYGFDVPVINGDAPAGTRSNRPEVFNKTRFGLIEAFQAADGFRICILSPVAAGVGLTITAANHVIHLERSWNPAKEAQATDRVYRIGAQKPVFVHVPILIHPDRDSFDVNLDRLLRSKVQLQDALTLAAPEEVESREMLESLFGPKKFE
jgi:hypothetical protein